jgi:hypothetical protein
VAGRAVTARLPSPQASRALLIGASRYRQEKLPDLPAVVNNLDDLFGALTDPAFGALPESGCVRVVDPPGPESAGVALANTAGAALDTVIVYYAGHGLVDDRSGELYLALAGTNPDHLRHTALPYESVRQELADCPARNRIVILDCCFSGRAIRAMSGADAVIRGQLEISGTFTLTSAPATRTSVAPPGRRNTAFTGELLGLLRDGVPELGALLSLGDLYTAVRRRLQAQGLPVPERHNSGLSDHLALARNRAAGAGPTPRRPVARSVGGTEASASPELAEQFHRLMVRSYQRAQQEIRYNPVLFIKMIAQHGGVGTAKRLLRSPAVSSGFTTLWERHRLDLTVEAMALQPPFAPLFTSEELRTARDRLAEYGYDGT